MPAVSQSDGASLGPVEVVELAATGKSPPPPSFDAILQQIRLGKIGKLDLAFKVVPDSCAGHLQK